MNTLTRIQIADLIADAFSPGGTDTDPPCSRSPQRRAHIPPSCKSWPIYPTEDSARCATCGTTFRRCPLTEAGGQVAPVFPAMSTTTRLVTRAMDCARACTCAGQPEVQILRGFDDKARTHARAVRDRIRRSPGVTARDAPMAVLALAPTDVPERHACVYIDITDQPRESARRAAFTHTPVVVTDTDRSDATIDDPSEIPVMRAVFVDDSLVSSPRVFPSVVGRIADVALETFMVTPNQPETGDLSLRTGDERWRHLEPGTSISVRCLPETMLVEAIDHRGDVVTWFASRAQVRRNVGLHRVYRDGLSITDLDEGPTVHHDPKGLRRHIV